MASDPARFRLGVAGAGRMGRTHIRALGGSDKVQVVAVAEPLEAARESLADQGLAVFADLDDLLGSGGVDGVLVAVPTPHHLDTVKRVLAARLPVLCEKPCGVTVAEAREAAKLAAAASLPFQVAYWRRFVPALCRLRERIAAGELGDLYLISCYQWDGEPPSAAFRAQSGGIFVDMGVHEFDQARWLTGQEFTEITAVAADAGSDGRGDHESAEALSRLSDGTVALVSLGRRFPLGDVCRVEVFGTRGWDDCRFLWPPDAEAAFTAALRLQAESFADFARGGRPQGAGPADAIAALEAAEQSASAVKAQGQRA